MTSIKDVAARAGVGLGTVSRVINGKGYVAEATARRVRDAIEELGYVPNEIGRSFQSQSSRTIALIVPSINHPLFADLAFSVEHELSRHGYRMMLGNSLFEVEKEIEFVRLLDRNVIDGMVLVSNSDIEPSLKPDLPIVTIDRHLGSELSFVTADNYRGGRLAAEHLLATGCRHLAYVGGFPGVNSEVFRRRDGFVEAVEATPGTELVRYDHGSTILDEDAFVRSFVREHPLVDGVFCLTDMLALNLVQALDEAGLDVPEAVQVVGFDGIYVGTPLDPHLTTVCQPMAEMGRRAAELVLAGIAGDETESRNVLDVELRIGRTTRPSS